MCFRFFQGYARKGAALHGMDRWGEAIAAYQIGLKMEPDNAALRQGIEDATKRHMLAGGDWKFIGNRQVQDDDGEMNPLLGNPTHLCAGPPGYFCYMDQKRSLVRVVNMEAKYANTEAHRSQQLLPASCFLLAPACSVLLAPCSLLRAPCSVHLAPCTLLRLARPLL